MVSITKEVSGPSLLINVVFLVKLSEEWIKASLRQEVWRLLLLVGGCCSKRLYWGIKKSVLVGWERPAKQQIRKSRVKDCQYQREKV